jgi:hypothetical protein
MSTFAKAVTNCAIVLLCASVTASQQDQQRLFPVGADSRPDQENLRTSSSQANWICVDATQGRGVHRWYVGIGPR